MSTPRWPEIRLLDRLAHDLRGPLTPLQTASYLLRNEQIASGQKLELIAVIERQTRRLGRMLEELGEWARVGQDRLLGPRERCEAGLLLDFARTAIGNDGVAPIIDDQSDAAVIDCDPQQVTRLLQTLMEYGAARRDALVPNVSLRTRQSTLRIDVRNIGQAPEGAELASLLEQPQPEPYDEGLGLRLLIACAIAEAHGGTLVACDDDGQLLLRCELPVAVDRQA